LTGGSDEGDLVVGLDGVEPYTRAFPLEALDAAKSAARNVHILSLKVALPIFVLDPGTTPTAANILRAHVAGCRFIDFDAVDLAKLDRVPDRAVKLGHYTYGLWKLPEPIDGDELAALQRELRDTLGGDPSWPASPLELFPVAGVLYEVAGEGVEAIELKVGAS
jgi:hypothetical protein